MDEQDDTRLDTFLRDKLGAYRPAPADAVWNAIESRLGAPAPPPAPRRAWGGYVLPALVAGLLGVLLGWLLPRAGHDQAPMIATLAPATTVAAPGLPAAAGSAAPASNFDRASIAFRGASRATNAHTAAPARWSRGRAEQVAGRSRLSAQARHSGAVLPAGAAGLALVPAQPVGGSASLPAILLPLLAAENAVATTSSDSATTARTHYQQALYAEKRALARLQQRADSLLHLLALGAEATVLAPSALPVEDNALPAAREVVIRREPRLAHRWLVALTGAPERAFLRTTAPATDNLATLRRHHEAGRTGLSATVQAEYRLSERVSVGAGAGYTRLNTELRLTEQHTTMDVRYVTTTVVNGNQTITTTTPIVEQRTTESYRVLRPTYHFLTVPVLVRYRLTPATRRTRCWADVAVGAQAQLFRGGTQLVSPDGNTLQVARVGAGDAAFRPATVALTGALAVNYALTPRLAASLAPAVRWQPQSVYRRGSTLQQRPTSTGLQLGLHWTL